MHVCLVVPYDVAEEGGVKRHALHLAEAMRRAGDQVDVVAPLSRGAPPPHVHGFGGVINIPANGSANHMALFTPPWRVQRFFRGRRFDVVHFHEPMVPLLAYYALWHSPDAAHVATFHMYAERPSAASQTVRTALARLIYPSFEAGIAVSAAAADFAAPLWRRPLAIIPNGVPTGIYTPGVNGRPSAGRDPLRLLFVGNWRDRRKGLPVLIDACRRLHAQGVAFTLDVIGEGPRHAETWRVPGVTFHGRVGSEAALAQHYRQCDLFVAPATGQESFGIVLLEAMACGRPVVCSDIRGYRDVIGSEGAILTAPGDAEALARAIANLACAPERLRAMGTRNRTRAEAYDWDRIAEKVRGVYREAVAARGAQGAIPARDV